jgi:hypothetical protein
MLPIKKFVFSVRAQSAKDAADTITALETMASGLVEVYESGGKTVVSTSAGGKSVTYGFASGSGVSAGTITNLCYQAWREVQGMDDSAMSDWLKTIDIPATKIRFS